MVLNEVELRIKVSNHCGHKINKGETPCAACEKKLITAKIIDKQKQDMWRQHDDWHKMQSDKIKQNLIKYTQNN